MFLPSPGKIEEICDQILCELGSEKGLHYKKTEKGLWATSILDDVYRAFEWASLDNYSHFVDLGSGDGRVVAVASLFTQAAGIEIDYDLYRASLKLRDVLNLTNVQFYHGDFEAFDLDNFDFIYMYPDRAQIKIENRLKGWKGSVMIAGLHFEPSGWDKVDEKRFAVEKFTLYMIK